MIPKSGNGFRKDHAPTIGKSGMTIRRKVIPLQRGMTLDECRALRRLANVPRGVAETLMIAHGFTPELIAGLVLAGLATVVTDTARVGRQTIKVELVTITDAGRSAIER